MLYISRIKPLQLIYSLIIEKKDTDTGFIMEKVVATVLGLFVVLTILVSSPTAAKNEPLVKPLTRLEPILTRIDTPSISCPDGGSCSNNMTCCMGTSGRYFCCPETYGNCCNDYIHCCISGWVCDIANDRCIKVSGLQEYPAKGNL